MFPILEYRRNKCLSPNRDRYKKEIASVCLKADVRVLQQDKDRRGFLEYLGNKAWKTCSIIKYEIQGSYYIKVTKKLYTCKYLIFCSLYIKNII